MKNKIVLVGIAGLVMLSFYIIDTNINDNSIVEKISSSVSDSKNVTINRAPSTYLPEKTSERISQPNIEKIVPDTAQSLLRQKLCHDHLNDCVADTTLNFSTELGNATGDLQSEAVGILLQSTNFNDVFTKFSTEKSLPEAFQSESMLQQFVQAGIGAIPTAKEQTACSNTVCMVEVDVDSETDLTALNTIVNSEQWPMGSSVIVPVYDDQRLKFRIVTSRVHQVGTGVSIGAPK